MTEVLIDCAEIERELADKEGQLGDIEQQKRDLQLKEEAVKMDMEVLRRTLDFVSRRGRKVPGEEPVAKVEHGSERSAEGSQDFAGLTSIEAAKRALEETGFPMRAPEIAEYITKRGFRSESGNLANSLFTAMRRRDDIFHKRGRGEWLLKAWNVPQHPEVDTDADGRPYRRLEMSNGEHKT